MSLKTAFASLFMIVLACGAVQAVTEKNETKLAATKKNDTEQTQNNDNNTDPTKTLDSPTGNTGNVQHTEQYDSYIVIDSDKEDNKGNVQKGYLLPYSDEEEGDHKNSQTKNKIEELKE